MAGEFEPITWDEYGKKYYETGVKEGVLFVANADGSGYGSGVGWSGLTAFNVTPSGAEVSKLYANDSVYANLISAEEIGATIEAYTYPDAFAECDGSYLSKSGVFVAQQARKKFAFVCKTTIGNDTSGVEAGFKLHILYGCMATPSERSYATINDSPEAVTFSWELTTTPEPIKTAKKKDGTAFKPTAYICIDTTRFKSESETGKDDLEQILNQIYGKGGSESSLPTADEILQLLG